MLNDANSEIGELRVFGRMDFPGKSVRLHAGNKWFESGIPLNRIDDLLRIAHSCVYQRRSA
ncbi:MAG: hypothetical protein DMG96_41390 [Acidobacteria bacterium]|nr:MAG: hypothetical protein DMG96_41390 [Acidobacteriota bacterium]